MTTGLRQYTNHSAQTATPGQLVVMLYDGFLRFAAQGQAALASGEIEEAGKKLTRAQDIVTELRVTLDMTQGIIAQNLASLYTYVSERLTAARLNRDPDEIDHAVRCMSDLRIAWVQIASVARPATTRTGPVVGVNLAG